MNGDKLKWFTNKTVRIEIIVKKSHPALNTSMLTFLYNLISILNKYKKIK